MTLYDSYVFPRVASPFGQIELRISRDTENCFMQNSGGVPLAGRTVLHLAPTRHAILSIGEWVQRQNDEEGRLIADGIEIELKDTWTYEGQLYTGGVLTGAVSQYVPTTDGCGFLDALFADETIRYYGWLVFYPGDGSKEIFFAGTIQPSKITRSYNAILNAASTAELVVQKAKITLNPIADRIGDRTAELFVQTMSPEYTVSSEQGLTTAVPWYGGRTTYNPQVIDFETDVEYVDLPYWDGNESTTENGVTIPTLKMITYGAAEKEHRDGGGLGFRDTTYYENVWGIRLARIFDRIATLCGMTVSAPLETDFEFTEQPWNNTSNVYSEAAITDAATKLAVSYNHAFGVSSYDGASQYEYPITWKRDTPLTAILRDLCLQLGCYLDWEVEQTLGIVTLAMTRRRKQRGARPAAWEVIAEGGGEAERAISKSYVEVKCRGDSTTVRCPAGAKGEGISIELAFRTRPMGGKAFPVYPTELLQIDRTKSIYGQVIAFEVPDSEQASYINPDSWVLGAHLFTYYGTAGTNRYYDDSPWVGPVNAADWRGMYVVRSQTEKAGTWVNRDNAIVAAAQYYAREFLGDRVPIERKYYGIQSNTGKLQSIKPGIVDSWRVRGQLRYFRAKEIRRNLIEGTTTIQWEERPLNYDTIEDLSWELVDGGSGSSSSGGSPSSIAVTTVSSVTQGISGYGLAGAYAVYANANSLRTARARENGPGAVFDVQGVVDDGLPAIRGGTTASGYERVGVKGQSDSGSGVEGVSASGSAVKGTSAGLAGEFVGKTKTTTLQVTNGSGAGKFLQDSDGTGNAVWAAVPVMVGATSGAAGVSGLVPAPAAGDQAKVLSAAGTWVAVVSPSDLSSHTGTVATSSVLGHVKLGTEIGVNGSNQLILVWPIAATVNSPSSPLLALTQTGEGNVARLVSDVAGGSATPILYVSAGANYDGTAAATFEQTGKGYGVRISQANSDPALYVRQTGDGSGIYGESGSGISVTAYRNAASATGAVLRVHQDHANDDEPAVTIMQDGIGAGITVVRNNAAATAGLVTFEQQHANDASNLFAISQSGKGAAIFLTRNNAAATGALISIVESAGVTGVNTVTVAANTTAIGLSVAQTGTGAGATITVDNTGSTSPAIRAMVQNGKGAAIKYEGYLLPEPVNITNGNSPYTLNARTAKLHVDTSGGAVTINLPSAADIAHGGDVIIIDAGGSSGVAGKAITVTPTAGQTINGGGAGASKVLATNRGRWVLESDGANKWLLHALTVA